MSDIDNSDFEYEGPEIGNWNDTNVDSNESIPQNQNLVAGSNITNGNYNDNSDYTYDYGDIGQRFDLGQKYNNYGNLDGLNSLFQMNNGLNGQTDYSFPGYNNYHGLELPQGQDQNTSWGDTLTKMLGGLGGLFSQNKNGPQANNGLKGLSTILGALLEGRQNTQNAKQSNNIINQQQQSTDPFATQRPFYQQQLRQSVENPYSSRIVSDQVEAIKHAQAIKNAAAGRRSNSATTDPEMLRAMAEVAQKYQTSLYQPSGANFKPDSSGLKELLAANQQKTDGYVSPLLSALGYNVRANSNSNTMDQSTLSNLVKVLAKLSNQSEEVQ